MWLCCGILTLLDICSDWESLVTYKFYFHFSRSIHTGFPDEGATLLSHREYTDSLFLHPCQYLLISLVTSILTGMRWNFKVVFVCISLMAKDAEHSYLLAIFISSFKNSLFKSITHFFNLFTCFLCTFFDFFVYSEF